MRFDSFIPGKRYIQRFYDPCVYYNKSLSGEHINILLYVDNMLIAFKSRSAIDKLKNDLSFKFKMKDLGEEKKVLDMKIERDQKGGNVSLTHQKFNMNSNTKSVSTPLAPISS